jgi:hypothetical protein
LVRSKKGKKAPPVCFWVETQQSKLPGNGPGISFRKVAGARVGLQRQIEALAVTSDVTRQKAKVAMVVIERTSDSLFASVESVVVVSADERCTGIGCALRVPRRHSQLHVEAQSLATILALLALLPRGRPPAVGAWYGAWG